LALDLVGLPPQHVSWARLWLILTELDSLLASCFNRPRDLHPNSQARGICILSFRASYQHTFFCALTPRLLGETNLIFELTNWIFELSFVTLSGCRSHLRRACKAREGNHAEERHKGDMEAAATRRARNTRSNETSRYRNVASHVMIPMLCDLHPYSLIGTWKGISTSMGTTSVYRLLVHHHKIAGSWYNVLLLRPGD